MDNNILAALFKSPSQIVDLRDVSYLNDLLVADGTLLCLPAQEILDAVKHPNDLMQWLNQNAIYQYPTLELVDYLKVCIGSRSALEICAGNAGVGRAAGIRVTDSYFQTNPDIMAYYKLIGQKPTSPPDYVERIDAINAIRKYKPQVVIGCFATHLHKEGQVDGSSSGVDEDIIAEMLTTGEIETYIHVGNEKTHANKPLLGRTHISMKASWLLSRAMDQSKNVIWEWGQG